MKLYIQNTDELVCDMEDGKPPFKMGWIQRHTPGPTFYCLCSWMTDMESESYSRPWLWQTAYPEEHAFDTKHEAMQALTDASVVAIIGGFRGRIRR